MAVGSGFALQDFMSKGRDFSRGYLFYVSITPEGGGPYGPEEIKYLVKSTNLPSSTITVAETNWQGNTYKLGTTQEFSDWTVSFLCDPNDDIRKTFFNWSTKTHNVETNIHGAPGIGTDGYLREIKVTHIHHNMDSVPIMGYKLIGAWPSVVGELSLDYSAKDMATFDVTFQYQYHVSEDLL